MLLWGTANPKALDDQYNGVLLNKSDVKSIVDQVEAANMKREPIPVLLEHKGVPIGRVVTAWEYKDTLQCMLSIDSNVFEGSISQDLIKSNICNDLSLGYLVNFQGSAPNSDKGGFRAVGKTLKEISIVKKGARHDCKIHAITTQ